MAVLFVILGVVFVCLPLAIFTCASHKKNERNGKDKSPYPRKNDLDTSYVAPRQDNLRKAKLNAQVENSTIVTLTEPNRPSHSNASSVPKSVVPPMKREATPLPLYFDSHVSHPLQSSSTQRATTDLVISNPPNILLDMPPLSPHTASPSSWSITANGKEQGNIRPNKGPLTRHFPIAKESNQSSTQKLSSVSTKPRDHQLKSPAQVSNPQIVCINPNIGPVTRHVPVNTISSQSSSQTPSAEATKLRLDQQGKPSEDSGPQFVQVNPNRGPITRLVPIDKKLSCQILSSHSTRPTPDTSDRRSYENHSHCIPPQGNEGKRKPEVRLRDEKTNKRAPATPIIVFHPSHPRAYHSGQYTHHNNGHYLSNKEEEEQKMEKEVYEDFEDDHVYNEDEDNEENVTEDDSEDDDPATLDLRGLFVREALATVKVFLLRQEQRYIESEFNESQRYVYVITGWGKLSPGHKPKLKPAVENLFDSTTYKLKYKYLWTNEGEMQVDLIGRKKEAELRKRSQERMKQKKKN